MKKTWIFLMIGAIIAPVAYAEDEPAQPAQPDTRYQVITSQAYVDAGLATKQRKIGSGLDQTTGENGGSGANGDVVTYTGTAGSVGAKKVYNSNTAYNSQTSYLVEAETVNTGIQNGLNDHLECAGNDGLAASGGVDTCWLYQINNLSGPYLPEPQQP